LLLLLQPLGANADR